VSAANRAVQLLLTSPLRRILSRSTALIRYTGPKSGQVHLTPVQYARYGDGVVIAVARSETKTWWRSFRHGHALEVLVDGTWFAMTGRVVDPVEQPDEAAPLLEAYRARFPRAAPMLTPTGTERTELVWCRP